MIEETIKPAENLSLVGSGLSYIRIGGGEWMKQKHRSKLVVARENSNVEKLS
jgi:hypothetical protein